MAFASRAIVALPKTENFTAMICEWHSGCQQPNLCFYLNPKKTRIELYIWPVNDERIVVATDVAGWLMRRCSYASVLLCSEHFRCVAYVIYFRLLVAGTENAHIHRD